MTKDTFINAWSRDLIIRDLLKNREAKAFLDEFYSAVVGFHKNMEITEGEINDKE